MQAFPSLWSADLLDVGGALDELGEVADGFHIDVMDGHFVPELLFGPDFVRAVSERTTLPIDVHLMVTDADLWVEPFAAAGAQSLVVHARSCRDPVRTLERIGRRGLYAAIALEVHEPPESLAPFLELVDRVVLMGTQLGVKGVDIDASVYGRLRRLLVLRDETSRKPELFVDGGLREETVQQLAAAGCEGVYPGSLVFGQIDHIAAVHWIQSLHRHR
jgi:ribulose-phosphate 3-epimerase